MMGFKTITAAELDEMETLVRVQFATSLPGYKPICLVGTEDEDGHTNLAPFSSVLHLGSSPALLGMVTRPDTVDRHTLSNILATKRYTLNHVHGSMLEAAHQCSARYPREVSEFEATGLSEERGEGGFVFVGESRLRMGMALVETVPIESNGTVLIVGSVECVQMPSDALAEDGSIDLPGLGSVASTALDTYFRGEEIARLPYAKPGESSGRVD